MICDVVIALCVRLLILAPAGASRLLAPLPFGLLDVVVASWDLAGFLFLNSWLVSFSKL